MIKRNVPGQFIRDSSMWRRLAAATWDDPRDPSVYGTLAIDATRALAYIRKVSEVSGERITITHLVVHAVAKTLAAHPECNAFVRLGRVFQRRDVDLFVLVALPDKKRDARADLNGVRIGRADHKTLRDIAAELNGRAGVLRQGKDPSFQRAKSLLDRVPPLLLKPALRLITFAQYDLNLDLSDFGVPRDSFAGAFVTSIGTLGISRGFPPLVPFARLSLNVAVGRIEDAPVVENGAVVVRPILPLTVNFDHRVVDGYQAARMSETFCRMLQEPERHLDPLTEAAAPLEHQRAGNGSPERA